MKKLLLISLLTLGFYTLQLSAMEDREDGTRSPSPTSNNVTMYEEETKEQDSLIYIINCANEKSIEIDKSQFEKLQEISHTIAHLMQDINDTTTLEGNVIPLHELESNVVQKILDLISTMPAPEQTADHTKFIEQLSQRPLDNLISLLMTANYLDIQSLLHLLSTAIAHKIVQEINAIPTGNFSQKILQWLELNKVRELSEELLNAIATKIVEQNPITKNIFLPHQILTDKAPIVFPVFSPDSNIFASVSYDNDKTILIWKKGSDNKFSLHDTLTGHNTDAIHNLIFSPDGNLLASVSKDKTIRIWKKGSDNKFSLHDTLTGHTDFITWVAFSPDGNTIASTSYDDTFRVWEKGSDNKFSLNNTLTYHTTRICGLAFSPDGNTIASAFIDDTIGIWKKDSDNKFSLHDTLTWHTNEISCLIFSPDGNMLISTSDDTIRIWKKDSDNKFSLHDILTGHTDLINHLIFSSDSNLLASASGDHTIRIWEKKSDNKFALYDTLTYHTDLVTCHAFSPDNNMIVYTSFDKNIRIWKKDSDNKFSLHDILTCHSNQIYRLIFSPDSNVLAFTSDDNTVSIWTKLPYQKFTFEQALVLLIWKQSKTDNIPFEVPQEESLKNAFDILPENLKDFLTNKEQ